MYDIKLCNNAFDNTYDNVLYFDNATKRANYFNAVDGVLLNDTNFIVNDLLTASVIFEQPTNAPLFKILNYNYAVVSNKETGEMLYYWIRKCEQISANVVKCYFEFDVMQNAFNPHEISESFITRAHLDRFVETSTTAVKFDNSITSKLFERENLKDLSKRVVSRQKLCAVIDTTNGSALNKWLCENVIAWAYVCVDYNHMFNALKFGSQETATFEPTRTGIKFKNNTNAIDWYSHATFCYPVLGNNSKIIVNHTSGTSISLNYLGIVGLTQLNDGYNYIYTIKLSAKPPFDVKQYSANEYSISDKTLTINANGKSEPSLSLSDNVGIVNFWSLFGNAGLLYLANDYLDPIKFEMTDDNILPTTQFLKSDIISASRSNKFNPKLNNSDYKNLTLTYCGSSVEYDLQKLPSKPYFLYREMITADVSKGLIQVAGVNGEIFTEHYNKTFNGLTFTNDLSLPMANSQLQTYLANNKNAYLSFANTQNLSVIKGLASMTGDIASAFTGDVRAGANAATTAIEQMAQLDYNRAQFDLTIDNMRSAPQSMENANGSGFLAMSVADISPYISIYEGLPNELDIANNYAYESGYVFNQYGKIENYIHTRKYFNFISANISNITSSISNTLKDLIKRIMAKGVRFWHTDIINFDLENYELNLEAQNG